MLESVGVREAKNRFSELTTQVNATGSELLVLKGGRPWVIIQPADSASAERRSRLERLRALTGSIESGGQAEPPWDPALDDSDLLGEERMRRLG